jgi:hypothetical protein
MREEPWTKLTLTRLSALWGVYFPRSLCSFFYGLDMGSSSQDSASSGGSPC